MKLSLVQEKKPNVTQLTLLSMRESNILVLNSYCNLHQIKFL